MLIPDRTGKNESGFTLIETLIAMVILSIALLGIAQMQISAMHGNRSSYDMTEASALASDIIEQMVIMSWIEEKAGYSGPPTVACPANDTVTPAPSKVTYFRQCTLSGGASGQRVATVIVSWPFPNNNHTLTMNSLL